MLITTNDQYIEMMRDLRSLTPGDLLALDTETTGLRPWLDTELRGISMAYRDKTWYVPISHPGGLNIGLGKSDALSEVLAGCAALPIYHNSPYDFAILERGIGLPPPAQFRDTQILAWLTDENRRKGLKFLGEYFFGEDAAREKRELDALMKGVTQAEAYKARRAFLAEAGLKEPAAASKAWAKEVSAASKRTWADLTATEVSDYAEKDADLTLRLYRRLLADKEYAEVAPAVQRHHDLQHVVYRMEREGIAVDAGRVEMLRDREIARMGVLAEQFDVNLDSPKQLAALVYGEWGLPVTERTDSGTPSTAREVLEAMAGLHDGLDAILEYRRLQKAVSSFYDTLLDNVDTNGRVHTSYNICGTVTGRFTSQTPNVQQIPKASTNADAKSVFVARPGYELWSYDLKSAELFVAASITGDRTMMAALTEEGRSFHKETAAAVFNSAEEPFYTLAKNLNYGIPYGIGPRKFSTYIAKGRKETPGPKHYRQAKAAIDAHVAQWPVLHAGISNLTAYAEVAGRVPLIKPGLFRRFISPSMAYPVPSYTAFNAEVQGGVAIFMGDVMVNVEAPALELYGAILLLQVHDSLVFEVPCGFGNALHRLLQRVADDCNPFAMRMLFDSKPGV